MHLLRGVRKLLRSLPRWRIARYWPDRSSRSIAATRPARRLGHPRFHLCAVGDILLGHDSQVELDAHGYSFPFQHLRRVIDKRDLLVGNLEGPITEHTTPVSPLKSCVLKQRKPAAAALREFGFDVLCLANNHILDYGPQGLSDTLRTLDDTGIAHFGAGDTLDAAIRGRIIEREGLRIGFLGFMQSWPIYEHEFRYYARIHAPGVVEMSRPVFEAAMRRLRPQVDLLVASFHWGPDHCDVTSVQRLWGRRAVHCGADLVLGHHPHVAQGVEVIAGVPVLYSLGNFAFGLAGRFAELSPAWRHGWIADITIQDARVSQVDLIPIQADNRQVRYQPRPAPGADLPDILKTLNRKSGTPLEIVGDRARLRLPVCSR